MTTADLTRNQSLVLDALRRSEAALGAYQILDLVRAKGIGAAPQVYRALDRLLELKLVHRIDRLNAYVHCDHAPHDHEVALAVCESCSSVTEVQLPPLDTSLAALADRGFATREARVEIVGTCSSCATGARSG